MTDEIYMTAIDGLYKTFEETRAKTDGWTAYHKINHAYQHFSDAVFDDLVRQDEANKENQEHVTEGTPSNGFPLGIHKQLKDGDEETSVDQMIQEYQEVFKRVRRLADDDLCAWLIARDWIDRKLKQRSLSKRRLLMDDVPMTDVQFCLLESFGIQRLADLSRWEAQAIIDRLVNAEEEEQQEG